jgi:hypothetical protein
VTVGFQAVVLEHLADRKLPLDLGDFHVDNFCFSSLIRYKNIPLFLI